MAPSSMTPYGYHSNSCGYCGGRASGGAYYAASKSMQPEHYQILMDRGWRRSGTTYYKPDLRNACCPHYTIRLEAAAFRPNKSQRKVVNDLNKYLIGQEYKRAAARLAPRSREEKRFRRNNWELTTVVHEAEYSRLAKPIDPKSGVAVEPAHTLHITLEPDNFTEEKFDLFENYQRIVHREPPSKISRSSFREFLCSGFPRTRECEPDGDEASSHPAAPTDVQAENGSGKRLGSHHHCYRLDGKLVALGVLDLLPHGLSSVYLIYHESVASWQFGKISAMQELALTRECGYEYYYMGYYIHSCTKMKYKMEYKPQQVLDVLSYNWHKTDQDFWDSFSHAKFVAITQGKWAPQQPVSGNAGETSREQHSDSEGDDKSIWTIKMPGVLSVEDVAKEDIPVRIQVRVRGRSIPLGALLRETWTAKSIQAPTSIQNLCAQWVACVGLEMLDKIDLELGL